MPNEEARVAFDELKYMCRTNGMASGATCNPIIFEPMVTYILLSQQKKLRELEHKLNYMLGKKYVPSLKNRVKANYKVHVTKKEYVKMKKKQTTLFPENEDPMLAGIDLGDAEKTANQ